MIQTKKLSDAVSLAACSEYLSKSSGWRMTSRETQ